MGVLVLKRFISLAAAVGLLLCPLSALPRTNDDVFSISAGAQTSGDWEYRLLDDSTAEVTGCKSSSANISIPQTLDGIKVTKLADALFAGSSVERVTIPQGVTAIGGSAFAGCEKLKSVTLPDSVKQLGTAEHGFVFLGCKALENITLPSSLTAIEQGLFSGCEKLKSITIPKTVTSIGYEAFGGCRGLTVIELPESVKSVDDFTFDGCTSLTAINTSDKNSSFCSADGVLYNKEKTRIIRCPASKAAISIPSSVIEISSGCFADNREMTSAVIPSTVGIIGKMAFSGCTKLKNIYVNSANKNFSALEGILYNKDKSQLLCCPGGKTVLPSLPLSVKSIGYGAFYANTNLQTVQLPINVGSIGEYAFAHSALKNITIGENVKTISNMAFYCCKELTDVTLTKGVETLGEKAFANCTKLKSVYIPSTVKSIGSGALGVYSTENSADKPIDDFVLYCERSGSEGKGYAKQQGISCKTAPDYKRLAGKARYDTAAAISGEAFASAETVIIASGLDYADALAGVPLAKAYSSPILLAGKDSLTNETLDEIKRLGAKAAIILGGEKAIGKGVETALKQNGFAAAAVRRIAGKTRFETAALIAQELEKHTKTASKTAFVVSYTSCADALSASTAAALSGSPILYAAKSGELNAQTKTCLAKADKAFVIGGDGVISDKVLKAVSDATKKKQAERIFGANRYKTCVAVNERFKDILTGSQICVAKGLDFPDALAGGVLACMKNAPMFLADGAISAEQINYIKSKKADSLYVLGGIGAVSEKLVQSISAAGSV
jgi:putative cell wall-binding protein